MSRNKRYDAQPTETVPSTLPAQTMREVRKTQKRIPLDENTRSSVQDAVFRMKYDAVHYAQCDGSAGDFEVATNTRRFWTSRHWRIARHFRNKSHMTLMEQQLRSTTRSGDRGVRYVNNSLTRRTATFEKV